MDATKDLGSFPRYELKSFEIHLHIPPPPRKLTIQSDLIAPSLLLTELITLVNSASSGGGGGGGGSPVLVPHENKPYNPKQMR